MRIPNNWNQVTLERWAALMETIGETPETERDIVDRSIRRVMLITGCSPEEARKFPLNEVQKVDKLLNTELPNQLKKRFTLNGITYKVVTRLHKLPSGEVKELAADASIMKTGPVLAALNTKGDFDKWHQAIFNVCKPVKRNALGRWKEYEFEAFEIKDRIEDFKQLTLDIANPIAVFFSLLSKEYYNYTLDFLANQQLKMQQMLKQSEKELADVGVGM